MSQSLEETLIDVWRQALVNGAKTVQLAGQTYSVRTTSLRKLKHIDFRFDGQEFRGIEQNPETKSRWAVLARRGKKVMQFLQSGRYVAVVADGKLTLYGKKK